MRRPTDTMDDRDPPMPLLDFAGGDLTLKDRQRLGVQLQRVADLMADGEWRTLEQIGDAVGAPLPSVSARLRDLRRPKCGCWTVERRRVTQGLWAYRAVKP